LRHRATLLCDDHLPQDAVHVALTEFAVVTIRWRIQRSRMAGTFVLRVVSH
jgi:hypothetical protein